MKVDWVEAKQDKAEWLGAVPALVLQAKQLLFSWKQLSGAAVPVNDYGTLNDLTNYWSQRDQSMMDAFVDWWSAKGGQPPAFKQLPADTPTQGQVNALLAWAASQASGAQPIEPAQFPSSPPSFPFPVLAPVGWPAGVAYPPSKPSWWPVGLQYPPIGTGWPTSEPAWWTAAGASLPNWPPPPPTGWPAGFPWPVPPESVKNSMSCNDLCDAQFGPKGTMANSAALISCKLACGPLPGGGLPSGGAQTQPLIPLRPTPAAQPTTTTAAKPSVLPLVLAGAAAIGLGWFFFRRGALLQSNPEARPTFTVYLERVPLNQGGYDRRGRYWGVGAPLYRYYDTSGALDGYVRAYNREEAKSKARYQSPGMELKFKR